MGHQVIGDINVGIDSPRRRFARHPSLPFGQRGDFFLYPLFGFAEERVVQRSVDRVSRLCAML